MSMPADQLSEPSLRSETDQIADLLLKWKGNPVAFVREALGAEPEGWQTIALETIAEDDRLTIRSGHGVGKSALLAWTIIWWISTRYPSKIACTAPTSHQLYDVLWSEVAYWIRNLPKALASQFIVKNDRIELKDGGTDTFASARTSRRENPDALQGFHSPNMLFLVDEAPGVEDIVFEVAQGALSTRGAKIIMAGNPTRPNGFFHRSHHSENWTKMHVPCDASTMVDPGFIKEMEEQYGLDSNVYRVRVLGEFPSADEDAFIPLHIVQGAVERDINVDPGEPVLWGLDVARSLAGDHSALAKRQGTVLLEPVKTWRLDDAMELVGRVQMEYDTLQPSQRPEYIFVDSIGMGGPVADRLRQLKMPAVDVNVADTPSMKDVYAKLRDELYGDVRRWFNTHKVKIPEDDELVGELTTIQVDPKAMARIGKIKLETKVDMKKRGVASPNRSDAVALTFAFGGAAASGALDSHNWRESINEDVDVGWLL